MHGAICGLGANPNIAEHHAQLALGHNSKAIHRAYSRKAQVFLPPLEDYGRAKAAEVIPMPQQVSG